MSGTSPETLPTTPDALFGTLAALGIETETVRHDPVFSVEESRELRGRIPGAHCKSLFFKDKKGALFLLVTLEDRRLDLKALGDLMGAARLSFASPERLMRHLGVVPGAVTPFALINDPAHEVKVVLDAEMMRSDLLNYHPLRNDMTTTIGSDDLLRFIAHCGHAPVILDLTPATRG